MLRHAIRLPASASASIMTRRCMATAATAADCRQWTIASAAAALKDGSITSSELTSSCVTHATSSNTRFNAFVTLTPDSATKEARAADERRVAGQSRGTLDGIPIAIKDNFCTDGVKTTASSRMLHNFVPPYSSTVAKKLSDAGAVCIGKTNMDEFAMGSFNSSSFYGRSVNPWSTHAGTDLSPGGSSGGSAVAVAARSVFAAIGSDTGGSVRLPASYCGLVGLKPTYGRVSRWGLIEYASSMDTPGVITRTVDDARTMLSAIAGADTKDSTSAQHQPPLTFNTPSSSPSSAAKGPLAGMTIGIPREYHVAELPDEITQLWHRTADWLKQAGATIVSVSLPHTSLALPSYYILAPSEATSNLSRYEGAKYGYSIDIATATSLNNLYTANRSTAFGDEVQRRILLGSWLLSSKSYQSYVAKAQQIRRLITRDFDDVWSNGVDMVLTPTSVSVAPSFDQLSTLKRDPVAAYINDVMTIPSNLAGIPSISVPAGVAASSGLPLGMQLMGRQWQEASLLRAAEAIERASGFTLPSNLA